MYETPDFEDLFKLVTIDKIRKKRITVRLVDEDGDEVPLKEAVLSVNKYVEDKMKDKTNSASQMVNQIFPLCTQAMVSALPVVAGENRALQIMAIDSIRWPMIMMMLLSFSLLKFVQQKKLKIVTVEEDISDEEYEKVMRISDASEAVTLGALQGLDPKDILKEMVKTGRITVEDLKEATGGKVSIEPDLLAPGDDDESDPSDMN